MEIDKNQLKKILDEQRKQYERYLKILLEDSNGKFKIFGEGIDGLRQGQEKLWETMEGIREMVAKNTIDIEIIKSDISFIKSGLKEKVDRDEFTALEKRVIFLESKLKRA